MSILAKANQEVDITKVPPQQLQELSKAIEEEVRPAITNLDLFWQVRQITIHYQQLHQANNKFSESVKVLNYIEQRTDESKELMVPNPKTVWA